MDWMIYGANGYTGELIAREARARGMRPIIAGRNSERVGSLAAELGLEHRAFALGPQAGREAAPSNTTADELAAHLAGVAIVLHCAGPFSATSAPMVDACIAAGAHYLDITGEIEVFENIFAKDEAARRAGVVLCPGVGFDVVPTDCVAAKLAQALPDATHLALGFHTRGRMSAGTAKSTMEGLARGGRIRENQRIVEVPFAHRIRRIDFGDGERWAMTVPWGDVSTAFHTTGIANIEVYVAASRSMIRGARMMNHISWLTRTSAVQSFLRGRAARVRGPSSDARAASPTFVWGEVANGRGDRRTARIKTDNGYTVTVAAALAVVDHLLRGPSESGAVSGAYTPAKLCGADLLTRLPGSGPLTLSSA